MNTVFNELLVSQIKERQVTVRALHKQIGRLCEKNSDYQWLSLATLERRLQNPASISEEEHDLIKEAFKKILSESMWIHVQRNITERLRFKYAQKIDVAVSQGFALPLELKDYDNTDTDREFVSGILTFYRQAPVYVKKWWLSYLETYLKLPNLAKATILCSSYIGRSLSKNTLYDQKIRRFLEYFPFFYGISDLSKFDSNELSLLGSLMTITSDLLDPGNIPDVYRDYAIDKRNIPTDNTLIHDDLDDFESGFCRLATAYKNSIVDYKVSYKDYIHECCFVLFVDRVEWLLAFATAIFVYRANINNMLYSGRKEYHPRGCTGFKFTDKELDYLCELLYIVEH